MSQSKEKGLHEFMLDIYKEGFSEFDEWKISMIMSHDGEWACLELKIQNKPPTHVCGQLWKELFESDIERSKIKEFFIKEIWRSIEEVWNGNVSI